MPAATGADAPLFAPTEPSRCGWLAVPDGHRLYFEECGPPDGIPVLFLHGGPGSGCQPRQRQLFDPSRYRAILLDQRGCGRSEPLGALAANTTAHLVQDLEALRQHLGLAGWFVLGGSWGSTLALAYAQRHPGAVRGLVLRGLFLGSRQEVSAYLEHPQFAAARGALEALAGGGKETAAAHWQPTASRSGRLLASLAQGMAQEHRAGAIALAWLNYEAALMGLEPLQGTPDAHQRAKVRVQLHYLAHDCFLAPGELLQKAYRLRGIPGVIVQGLRDAVCPPQAAAALHRAWPQALWLPVAGGGHSALSPPMASATIRALERLCA